MRKNFNYTYVSLRKLENDWIWKNEEKWLYYSYKNEDYIIPTILACAFFVFFGAWEGILYACITVGMVLYLCHVNNENLDKSERIIEKRKDYIRWRLDKYKKEKEMEEKSK